MLRASFSRTLLPLLALTLACTDEDPSAPGAIGLEPAAYVAPNTGLGCGPDCLTDDVDGPWSVIPNPPRYETLALSGADDPPTHQGGVLEVTWCRVRNSDGYQYPCSEPASWWQNAAAWPSRKVQIGAREASNITRVLFESYAPEPEVELMEFERPDQPYCHTVSSTVWCEGSYRLKVSIRNAGWYNTDRFYVSVLTPSGLKYGPSDAGFVVADEAVTWNWNAIPNAEPGSRLVVTYYPWEGKQEGKVELSVPLREESPALTLDATEAPSGAPPAGGPMGVQVAAGTPVLFTPMASGASIIEVLSWEWAPADSMQQVQTYACAPYENPCTVPVFEDGTMSVTARVDGQLRGATAGVGITPPRLIVACDGSVERGSQVLCTARVEPAQPFRFLRWTGIGNGFGGSREVNASRDASHVEAWEGIAVANTRVLAEAELLTGEPLMGSSLFTVSSRTWAAPPVEPGAPQYRDIPPILSYPDPTSDNAFGAFFLGEPAPAGKLITDGGPNDSLSYIDIPPALTGTGIAVYPGLLGPPYSDPPQMWHRWHADQDTQGYSCGAADVEQLRTNVERHEGVTRSADSHWGVATAEFANNNPYVLIEAIFSTVSRDDLRRLVMDVWLAYTNSGPYDQAQDNFEVIDKPLVYSNGISCVFDYNLRDP